MSSSDSCNYSAVVWEWLHDSGHWLPYSPDVTVLLDRSNSKNLRSVCLGDGDPQLSNFAVHLKNMVQISENTERSRPVRRQIYSCQSPAAWGVTWQWAGDDPTEFHPYAMEVGCVLEDAYRNGLLEIDLSNYFPQMNYTVNLVKMIQSKNNSGYQREIKRIHSQPYVMTKSNVNKLDISNSTSGRHVCPMSKSHSSNDSGNQESAPSTAANLVSSAKCSTKNKIHEASVDPSVPVASSSANPTTRHSKRKLKNSSNSDEENSKSKTGMIMKALSAPAKALIQHFSSPTNSSLTSCESISPPTVVFKHLPAYFPKSALVPVPDVDAPSAVNKRVKRRNFDEAPKEVTGEQILSSYSELFKTYNSEESCCICCDPLSGVSGYGDDKTVIRLNICNHVFHKSCILAMHESSNQPQYLQCPSCKTIHGVKTGNQPFGKIDYHIIPHSLPTYNCLTIRILYDIPCGIQSSEHPHPGKRFSARGFPRVCYLPDTEEGRKVLRLLVKAWERKLIFTVGNSVTTGEVDTVTWNEIHHKTEFGGNYTGHGYPDENYIENVLQELAIHGVVE